MFKVNQLDHLYSSADAVVAREKTPYYKAYKIIESYVKTHDLLIGGQFAINAHLEITVEKSVAYQIYGKNPFKHANNLANELAELTKYTFMKTQLAYAEFIIYINDQPVVFIYNIDVYKGLDLIKLMKPVEINGTKYIPAEILLIEQYRRLYSPNHASDWEDILGKTIKLTEQIRTVKKGGDEKNLSKKSDSDLKLFKNSITDAIIKEYLCDNDSLVLIGQYATNHILGESSSTGQLQIITGNSVEAEYTKVQQLIHKITNSTMPVHYKTHKLKIITDFRISRLIVYIGESIPILHIFNSGSFELIPFNTVPAKFDLYDKKMDLSKNKIQIANPFVVCRFLLIDFWTMKIICNLGSANENYAKKILQDIHNQINLIIAKLQTDEWSKLINSGDVMGIFQLDDYIGIYENESSAKKVQSKESRYHAPYQPYKQKLQTGEYRKI